MQFKTTNLNDTIAIACDLLEPIGLCSATLKKFLNNNKGAVSVVEYKKDDTVFSRDRYLKALGVICDGALSSQKRVAGGDFTLRTLQKGDIFGVAGIFTSDSSYVSDIIALTDATVVYFPEALLSELFCAHPDLAISYIRMLSKKIRYLNAKLDGFATPNAYSKLALFLYENNGYHGSMTSLADLLDMSRMTLYRNLEILEEEKNIEKIGKTITVINPDLASLFDSSDEIL